jgi:hypothetical protein
LDSRGPSGEDRLRGVFRISTIGLPFRSAHRAIGTIDFKHLDLMIAQHAGQFRSIGAGPFNSGATQTTERISPGQIGPTFRSDLRLSIPTISLPAHAANHVMLLEQSLVFNTRVLTG